MEPAREGQGEDTKLVGLSEPITEVFLLLSEREAAAVEAAARRRGLTMGQWIRTLIRDFLATKKATP
jgi:hypothetical protein